MKKYVKIELVEAEELSGKNVLELEESNGKLTVTQKMVDDFIDSYETITLGNKTTVTRVILKNGYEITEATACVDEENYSEKIGEEICLGKIKDKIWSLLAFLLQTAWKGVDGGYKD